MQSRMRNEGIGQAVRRAGAVAVLGWLAVLGGSVLVAPAADAAPSADVVIRDLTPPLVSIDPGGTVTFSNGIADKTVQVGGGGLVPSLVTVLVHTDVTLTLPSGDHPLQPGQSVSERFADSCLVGCAITYTYRAQVPDTSVAGSLLSTVSGKALATLPQNQVVSYDGRQTTVTLGVPTPFLVTTILPLPNLPSLNLPQLPAITVPLPNPPSVGTPAPPVTGQPGTTTPTPTTPEAAVAGIGGPTYSYGPAVGAAQLAPGGSAGTAFDGSSTAGGAGGSGSGSSGSGSGSGGVAGGNDGGTAPTFGRLAGLNRSLDGPGDGTAVASDAGSTPVPGLSVPALLAVIALAGGTTALVRARRVQRR